MSVSLLSKAFMGESADAKGRVVNLSCRSSKIKEVIKRRGCNAATP
jgi:hypothetical protein